MADITKYYSLTDALKQYGQINGESNPNATTMQDMQAYMQQNGDTLENVVKAFLWQPETNIVVGQEVHSPNLPAGYMAVCTVAGTTGTTEPSWSTTYSTFTDGTVTWTITSLYSGKANKSDVVNKVITTEEEQGNIKRSVDNSYVRFSGGTNETSGAGLILFGKSAETFGGHFMLDACTSEDTTCRLEGNPNGDLTWDGKNVCAYELFSILCGHTIAHNNSIAFGKYRYLSLTITLVAQQNTDTQLFFIPGHVSYFVAPCTVATTNGIIYTGAYDSANNNTPIYLRVYNRSPLVAYVGEQVIVQCLIKLV